MGHPCSRPLGGGSKTGHPILGPWEGGQMQNRHPRHLGAGWPKGVGGGADGRRLAADEFGGILG
jgi:hypothetical protein